MKNNKSSLIEVPLFGVNANSAMRPFCGILENWGLVERFSSKSDCVLRFPPRPGTGPAIENAERNKAAVPQETGARLECLKL